MSHIAEGELHAWLDGALEQLEEGRAAQVREHLRGCAACREALVAEEAVRARAAEVLALTAPRAVEPPPFETLVARAHARDQAAPVRRMSRGARMGWAASVVLALGAGWMARDLGLSPDPVPAVAERDEAAGSAAAETEIASASPVLEETQPVPAGGDFASGGRVAAEPATEASRRGRVESAEADARALAFAPPPPPSEPALSVAGAEARNADSRNALLDRLADVAAAPPPSREILAAQAAAPPALAETLPTPAASTGGAAVADVQRREAPRSTPRVQTSALQSSAGGVGIQQPVRDTVVSQRAEAISGVADADEMRDISVPGLEVLYAEWSQIAPGQPSRRVLQQLASGDTLEIRFVRSVPRTVADPLATLVSSAPLPGWSQVVKLHRDGWLVARAPIAQSELDALVARAGIR